MRYNDLERKTLKKILINKEVWQTRVAILHDEKLQDIYFFAHSRLELERCFFKGRISKVLPGIQTAFVDIGQTKAGFLHISEIDRALAAEKMLEPKTIDDSQEQSLFERTLKRSMDIGKIFKEGEETLVQVIKEPIYEKGAKLTTCFTLPGKFVVLMPNIPQIGISKKIETKNERTRLKEILLKNLPKGMGAIIRTTAQNRTTRDIKKDLSFLITTWKSILKKVKRSKVGEKIHEDLPISLRAVRDHLDADIEVVIIDDKSIKKSVSTFVKSYTPEHLNKIKLYKPPPDLFDKFEIERQIFEALQKKVTLKSGGSIIIEATEAMTVVDVNTGKYTGKGSLEETILKTNLEAAEEIVRQLRLRNIGGLIVIDFIDMANISNRQKLSKFFDKTLKERDKYQSVMLKVSEFGIIQMTRKRSGKTLVQQLMQVCPRCNSGGYIKSISTISFEILKQFAQEATRKNLKGTISLSISNDTFEYLLHNEFKSLLELETALGCRIILESNEKFKNSQFSIDQIKEMG
jgi:ribonuclease G